MVIVYGHRAYGRVERHGGQFAQTKFAHIYYMPLFPTGSFWVTGQDRSGTRGFPIRLHGKSVLATYLRMWGPIAAIACLAAGGVATFIGIAIAALSVLAWTWTGTRHRRRSDFNLVAFGSRCEPALMLDDTRDDVRRALDVRWERISAGRPPEDVARYGANTLEEAAAAYGLLRLAAPGRAPEANAAAERILAGELEPLPAGDGPYREAETAAAPRAVPSAVIREVESLAAAHHVRTEAARADARRTKPPWWRPNAAVLFVFALAGLGGIIEEGPALAGATAMTASELAASTDSSGFVSVACSKLDYLGNFVSGESGYRCMMAGGGLVVVADGDRIPEDSIVLDGTLSRFGAGGHEWPDDIRDASGSFYLTESSIRGHQIAALLCILGELVLAGFLVRALRRRRQARTQHA
ncbi:MAG: hypothetical protein ABI591_10795 [Kofleriaceae bacterium]